VSSLQRFRAPLQQVQEGVIMKPRTHAREKQILLCDLLHINTDRPPRPQARSPEHREEAKATSNSPTGQQVGETVSDDLQQKEVEGNEDSG
jgi:hypothetical protein